MTPGFSMRSPMRQAGFPGCVDTLEMVRKYVRRYQALAAWDLQKLSRGRFELGLGTQVRQNIEERYSARWLPPAAGMKEYVDALSAQGDPAERGGRGGEARSGAWGAAAHLRQ